MTTVPAGERVSVRTARIDAPDDLLALLPDPGAFAWVRAGDGLVAWGEAFRTTVSGPDRFAAAAAWWRDLVAALDVDDDVRTAGTGPVAFGSFAFADHPGTSVVVVPRVVVGRRGGAAWVTTVGDAPAVAAVGAAPRRPVGVRYSDGSLGVPEWETAVAAAVARIGSGDLDKVVLARDVVASADGPVDPRWLLAGLAERYPGCWTFHVDGLVGATPELLLRRERDAVTSRVLAGTVNRYGDDVEDRRLAAALLASDKDLEEHAFAVRSVADALDPHCAELDVPTAPRVLRLANVQHLATDVVGRLSDGSGSLALAAALHPTAAVAGTPTATALALIDELEGMDRGRYAGPVGWMDAAGDGEWGIALRCAQVDATDPSRLRLFAGCGIVAGSDPAAELAESQAKLVPMRDALER